MGLDKALGINTGNRKRGKLNLITDVKGVKVGHCTVKGDGINTGVTAILPHGGDTFHEKVIAAPYVINGYGKSIGLMQMEELGTLETPIILTNTLSVGTAATATVRYMMERCPEIGGKDGTVNPVVCECNDGRLSDIRGLHVKEEHVFEALTAADTVFDEGAVGAGTGMSCFDLKGGVGSASGLVELDGVEYTVGVLALTNFGELENFRINGKCVGEELKKRLRIISEGDKGSVIIVIATDIPVNERQLRRMCLRAGAGLARVGSFYGNGSGDIVVGFSPAQRIPHNSRQAVIDSRRLVDGYLDRIFPVVVDCVEESVLSSMLHAKTTVGKGGFTRYSLADLWGESGLK